MKIKALLFLLCSSMLVGCASGPKYTEVVDTFPAIASEEGRVYFYRSGNLIGSGIQPKVRLNGEVIGQSEPGGFFFVDRKPGDYEVLLSTEVDKKLTFQLHSGEEKYVKMSVGLGAIVYRVYPELVQQTEALKDMEGLSFTGNPNQ
ncbi:MAG: DUF2846 domain-containing protein [Neptuniibacter sp.]